MNQNSVIFGALFVGFLVYITVRGELPKYAAVFTTSKATSGTSTLVSPGPPSNPTGQPLNDPNKPVPGTLGQNGVTMGDQQQTIQKFWDGLKRLFSY